MKHIIVRKEKYQKLIENKTIFIINSADSYTFIDTRFDDTIFLIFVSNMRLYIIWEYRSFFLMIRLDIFPDNIGFDHCN